MTIIKSKKELEKAYKFARGEYQMGILDGRYCLSGADLQGNAKKYIGRYRQSSQNLINRCKIAGIKIAEVIGDHNRRDLIIG